MALLNLVLQFILVGDVLPCGEEHLALCGEQGNWRLPSLILAAPGSTLPLSKAPLGLLTAGAQMAVL